MCTLNDYAKYNTNHQVHTHEDWLSIGNIEKRICPDMTGFEKFHRIKNGYNNQKERLSFSIEIIKAKCEEKDCD